MTAVADAPLTQTPPPAVKAPAYFEQPLPAAIILGSFFAVTLPMAAMELFASNAVLTWVYIWLFGITHFVITLTIYCTRANRQHFASNAKTALVFIAAPIAIFVAFDLIHAFRLKAEWPIIALVFFGAVRFFDFFHLNRQTFGVLQMFKGRVKGKYPAALRTAENRYLISFVFVLMLTFLAGGVCPLLQAGGMFSLAAMSPIIDRVPVDLSVLQGVWLITAVVTVALFVQVVMYHRAMQSHRMAGPAMLYLLLQTFSAVMAAIYLPLYLATLAIHYVEYHVLMVPRVFHSKLDDTSRIDRTYGRLRARPILFIVAVLLLAAVVTRGAMLGMNAAMGAPILDFVSPVSYLMLIAMFDGIFVFHYFVEMYIWKFSDPWFRQQLSGLYFSPKPA